MNRKRILRYIRNLIIFFFASTILSVVALRFIPVYITPLMVIRSVEQLVKGEKVVMKHKWVPKEKISRHLPMAVIASEDNRFASHNGFDFKEISKAIEEINRKNGHNMVRIAVQGYDKRWHLKCERISKRYTTDIDDIIEIKL